MLAGAITASSRVVRNSTEKMNAYYDANNALAARSSGGTADTAAVARADGTTNTNFTGQSFGIQVYSNDTFSSTPVYVYASSAPSTP